MTLEARGIVCSFGATRALDGVDIGAVGGATVAVFGGNGAGKSTLLRVLTGERPPDVGSLTFDGAPVSGRDPAWRAKVGLVSHATGLYRNLTVAENLRFFADLHGVPSPNTRAGEVASSLEIEPLMQAQVSRLSRGQRQRVALARTLLHEPEVLLMDEPFTGLDPSGSQAISRVLDQFREQGRIVVVVTHDVPQGLALSDRTVVLQRGRKVLDDASANCSVERVNAFFGAEAPANA